MVLSAKTHKHENLASTLRVKLVSCKWEIATEEDLISLVVEAISERKGQVHKVFANLEIQRAATVNCTLEWEEFKEYFPELESSLQKKIQDPIANMEKAFESKSKELQESP